MKTKPKFWDTKALEKWSNDDSNLIPVNGFFDAYWAILRLRVVINTPDLYTGKNKLLVLLENIVWRVWRKLFLISFFILQIVLFISALYILTTWMS
jgi:hypothetical protein|tara:strand:+ start:66 stop:353 length:288 start_codon:yes stop_codon:yes gene_type:complete